MILVDTSIWVDHFRGGDRQLEALLLAGQVMVHPFVLGELVLANITAQAMEPLVDLPKAMVATPDEVMGMIVAARLSGSGIGYVDAHLIASSRLMPGARIWTREKHLRALAGRLRLAVPSVGP